MSDYRFPVPGSTPPDPDSEPGSESRDAGREPRESDLGSEDAGLESRDPGPGSEDSGRESQDSGLGSRDLGLESRDPGLGSEDAGLGTHESGPEPEGVGPGSQEPGSETQDSESESQSAGGGVWARLRKLDTRKPRPKAQDPGPKTQDSAPSLLQRLAGLERRRVPSHVFLIESGRLLYGRFIGEEPPLTLMEYHERPLPPGLWPDGPLGGPARDPAALAEVVKELVDAASTRPTEASLVVPDAWLRLAFTELNELPRAGEERDAVLRWKLKGLTPFRVDELRVEAAPMTVPGAAKATAKADADADDDTEETEAQRVLIGFGVDRLLSQLEEVFAGAGVRVGQLVNSGLALGSLAGVLDRAGALTALVYVRPEGYGLAFQHRDALLFHRVKLRGGDTDILGQVHRDLMLTRSYLEENFPALKLDALLLLAPEGEQFRWMQWLDDGFEREPRALGPEDLPVAVRDAAPENWLDAAPMLGAALGEY